MVIHIRDNGDSDLGGRSESEKSGHIQGVYLDRLVKIFSDIECEGKSGVMVSD